MSFDNDQKSGDIRNSNLYNIQIVTQSKEYLVDYIQNYEQIVCLQSEVKVSSYCASRKRALAVKKQFTKKLESNQFSIATLPLTIQCWMKVSQIMNDATFLSIQSLFELQGLAFKATNSFQSHFALQTNQLAFLKKTNVTQPFNQWLYYTYERSANYSAIYLNQNQWYKKFTSQTAKTITTAKLNLLYSSLQSGALQSSSPFEGYFAGLSIYQQVAASSDLHSRLSGIKLADSLLFYFHFAQFQTEKIKQSPTIAFQSISSNRLKLVDTIDLMLAPYDAYLSDDTKVNIQRCQGGQFYNYASKKCDKCPNNCQFCISQTACTKCKSNFYQAATTHQGIYTCEQCDFRCNQCFGGTNSDCNLCKFQKIESKCQCLNFFNFSGSRNQCQVVIQSQELTIKAINQINFQINFLLGSQTLLQIEEQFLATSVSTDPENPCGCQNQGICEKEQLKCTCSQGYKGEVCQYTDTVFELIISKKNSALILLEKLFNQEAITASVTIQAASNLIKLPDTVNLTAFDKAFDILQKLKNKKAPFAQILALLSAATKSAISLSNKYASTIDKLSNQSNSVVKTEITSLKQGASINQTTQNINISAVKASNIQGLNVGNVSIESFPAKVPNGSLSLIVFKQNIFKNLNKTQEINLKVQQLSIYSGQSSFKQSNNNDNSFIIRFDITQNPQIHKLAKQFYSGSPDQIEILRRKQEYFQKNQKSGCFYWHMPSSSWRKDGCSYRDIVQTQLICKCNHLAFYGAYLDTSILQESDGVLFEAWKQSISSLILTFGFYSIAGFWVFFFIAKIFVDICDKKLRKRLTVQVIMEELGVEKEQSLGDQSPNQLKVQSVSQILEEKQEKEFEIEEEDQDSQNRSKSAFDKGFSESLQSTIMKKNQERKKVQLKTSISQLFKQFCNKNDQSQNQSNKQLSNMNSLNLSRLNLSKSQGQQELSELNLVAVRARPKRSIRCLKPLKTKYLQQLKRKSCCIFCIFFKKEFQTNNILLNAFARTSIIFTRSMRFTLFLVTMLTILVSVAVLSDILGAENKGNIIDNVIENIWIEALSFIITVPLILFIGLLLHLSRKELKKLKKSSQAKNIKKKAKNMRKKYSSRRGFGSAFMYFLLIAYSLYFICFFAMAKQDALIIWLHASSFVVFVDVVVFEILAALLVEIMVQISMICKCNCTLIVVCVVTNLRGIKNLAL